MHNKDCNMNSMDVTLKKILKICFVTTIVLMASDNCKAQILTERIAINQVGFYPMSPKLAVITGEVSSNDFYITSSNLRDTFFRGKLSPSKQSAYSTTITRIADFSE